MVLMTLDAFLQAIIADPLHAETTWLVLADWLEEQGDPRYELVRLRHQAEYRRDLSAEQRDARVCKLLASGMQPVAPILENSIGMKFALIPPGVFLMGSPETEADRGADETQHEVEITRPFFMGAHPVTQQDYQRIMGKTPSHFSATGCEKKAVENLQTDRFPVEVVSWEEAVAFCEKLSSTAEEKKCGRSYRLPSEAEWEYSCRGGAIASTSFHFGPSFASTQANFRGDYPHGCFSKGPYLARPCEVGSYPANAFGLFDMHGNVWEWCQDWYDKNYYKSSVKRDPQGPKNGGRRVARGGSWSHFAFYCRSARRGGLAPAVRFNDVGFRVCFLLDL